MLVYKTANGSFAIHPCVEVNLRYTMGMVATRLFDNYLDDNASALFHIQYHADSLQAYGHHLVMEKKHPLTYVNGKMGKGYLSLCPVTKNTHYIAYILAT
jgi:hypothetical protein